MKIIHRDRIQEFIKPHPDSESSASAWLQIIDRNDFKHFSQMKQAFNSADYVKPYTIFNISGKKYRLITLINYNLQLMSIEYALTHSEYDKKKWRE